MNFMETMLLWTPFLRMDYSLHSAIAPPPSPGHTISIRLHWPKQAGYLRCKLLTDIAPPRSRELCLFFICIRFVIKFQSFPSFSPSQHSFLRLEFFRPSHWDSLNRTRGKCFDGSSHAAPVPHAPRSVCGYRDLPAVCGSMTFLLPPFKLASSRVIRAGGRIWEAWSPNSKRVAYYPGVPDAQFTISTPTDPAFRRADGHLGRFDPTRNPQLLDHNRLWYPFVRPDSDDIISTHPEHAEFHSVWLSGERTFDPDFLRQLVERVKAVNKSMELHDGLASSHPVLWSDRPMSATIAQVEGLGQLDRYDVALDAYARVQREVKLSSAWSKMAQALKDRPPSANTSGGTQLRMANTGWMGAWINGAAQEDVLWLLRLGIPCFVLHEVETYREQQAFARRPSYPTFYASTPVNDGVRNKTAADLAMENQGWALNFWNQRNGYPAAYPHLPGWSDAGLRQQGRGGRMTAMLPPPKSCLLSKKSMVEYCRLQLSEQVSMLENGRSGYRKRLRITVWPGTAN